MDRVKENEIYDKFQDLCNSHKDMIPSDDKHLCKTECPLRDANRCENVFFYQQGKADGTKEFAEWLTNYAFDHIDYVCNGHFINRQGRQISVDEVLAEWQKEQKNDIKRNNQETNSCRDI